MRLTGERPIEGKTPPSLLALHEAGYREVLSRIGPGRFLDLGCGLGDGTATFLADGRVVVGLDYDAATAREANRLRPTLYTVCSDGAVLSLRGRSFDWVCSSHLIEHFVDPEPHAAELARVLRADGAAFVITPNAPADFENPYHVHLFGPNELVKMLGRHFADVEVLGLNGDAAVLADFDSRRRWAKRLLAIDVFDLRHRLPRRWYVALHATARRVAYPLVKRGRHGASEVTSSQFSISGMIDDRTLVLFAVARRPFTAS